MSDEITPIDLREVADECTHDPVVRNHLRGAADIIEALRAANARLQAWHDAVRSDPWWYDEHGNEIMFRPQPLAKE